MGKINRRERRANIILGAALAVLLGITAIVHFRDHHLAPSPVDISAIPVATGGSEADSAGACTAAETSGVSIVSGKNSELSDTLTAGSRKGKSRKAKGKKKQAQVADNPSPLNDVIQ